MKNKKLAMVVLGMALIFGIGTAGCAGEEGSGSESTGQDSIGQGAESQGEEDSLQAESFQQEDEKQFGNLNEFQAYTPDGSTFTQDDFSGKDITAINFWALSCGPCLAEMPDLAELRKALPDNVELITVCLDGGGNEETVLYVLGQTGFEGTTLVAGDGDLAAFCRELQYTPTTVFVDGEGNTVGEAIVGGREKLAEAYLNGFNTALAEIGKDEISIVTE